MLLLLLCGAGSGTPTPVYAGPWRFASTAVPRDASWEASTAVRLDPDPDTSTAEPD